MCDEINNGYDIEGGELTCDAPKISWDWNPGDVGQYGDGILTITAKGDGFVTDSVFSVVLSVVLSVDSELSSFSFFLHPTERIIAVTRRTEITRFFIKLTSTS